jgi:hypothetical protein
MGAHSLTALIAASGAICGTILFCIKWKKLGKMPSKEVGEKIFLGSVELCFAFYLFCLTVFKPEEMCSTAGLPEILFFGALITIVHFFYKVATPLLNPSAE